MALTFQQGAPSSTRYQDIYFSREGGLDEARHVFITANGLPERWSGLKSFTVAETGFGTGLNFLATWQLWRSAAPPLSRLHYLSVEKHPLTNDELARCHGMFPELSDLSNQLLNSLAESPLDGYHRVPLQDGRVTLTLCHGDVVAMLRGMEAKVDCWFLDGFAPSKNPEMWSQSVFREVARLSSPGTSFATFTSAGAVRRGLSEQGFRVEKRAGFGHKREMCSGVMETVPEYRPRRPWFSPPRIVAGSRSALVIGAGIAGAQAAYHLARRGWSVLMLERHHRPALEASGNPAAVFSPFLTARPSQEEQFSLQCFVYLLRQLSTLDPDQAFHRRCGVLDISADDERERRATRIAGRGLPEWLVHAVEANDAHALSGLRSGKGGLVHPQAGWIEPARWIDRLLDTENIALTTGIHVSRLRRSNGLWQAISDAGHNVASAPVVVIASGRFMDWDQIRWLPLTPVAGQTTFIDADSVRGSARCVVRHDGYLVPMTDDRYLIGATYRRQVDDPEPDPEADNDNVVALYKGLREVMSSGNSRHICRTTAHSAIRMASENRLPLLGALPDPEILTREFPRMRRRSYRRPVNTPLYLPGLYLSSAWGSRGMTNAALGSELLASLICGEPLPMQADLVHAIHPARSIIRRLKRGAS